MERGEERGEERIEGVHVCLRDEVGDGSDHAVA